MEQAKTVKFTTKPFNVYVGEKLVGWANVDETVSKVPTTKIRLELSTNDEMEQLLLGEIDELSGTDIGRDFVMLKGDDLIGYVTTKFDAKEAVINNLKLQFNPREEATAK